MRGTPPELAAEIALEPVRYLGAVKRTIRGDRRAESPQGPPFRDRWDSRRLVGQAIVGTIATVPQKTRRPFAKTVREVPNRL